MVITLLRQGRPKKKAFYLLVYNHERRLCSDKGKFECSYYLVILGYFFFPLATRTIERGELCRFPPSPLLPGLPDTSKHSFRPRLLTAQSRCTN
uniref:Uncharacterized protein n=1 Tax=Anguilla anguilla TaxID=7936 RepID=A0A0E9UAU7_ANGAN